MNKYDQERINMIIVMIMYITGFTERKIFSYVKKTKTFLNILNGDELTLYDSYAANLIDMANEWKGKVHVPSALRNITAEQINESNKWLREQEIKDSVHAKIYLSTKPKVKQIHYIQKPPKVAMAVSSPKHLKIHIVNRFQKAPITTEEPLYKDM